jgi:LysM repeat protein
MKKEKIKIYKIQNGDNLSTVAKKFKTTPIELLMKNKISPKDFIEGHLIFID